MAKKSKASDTYTQTLKVSPAPASGVTGNMTSTLPADNPVDVMRADASKTPVKTVTKQEVDENGNPVKRVEPESGSGVNTPDTSNSGGGTGSYSVYGNATVNPYSNAYAAYQTAMGKVKEAQLGQLNTEYNNQQKAIEGAYQNLGRNSYINYMNRAKSNNQAASNMGVNRTGMAENMRTANAADYNRSVGNAGAYRQTNLSNAENAYNSSVAGVENEYATNMARAENEYRQLEIQRQNELADLQAQLDFQAQQNALDREQQAKESERAYQQQVQAYNDQVMKDSFDRWASSLGQYDTEKKVENAIAKLKDQKKNGELEGWKAEYYSDMLSYLYAQETVAKQNAKDNKKK